MCFFFSGQVISDLLNSSEFNDYARGWVKIIITILSFFAFNLISNSNFKKIYIFLLWIVILSLIISFLFLDQSFQHSWKFAGGNNLLILLLLFIYLKKIEIEKINFFIFSIIIILGLLSLYFSARSSFLFSVILFFHLFLLKNFSGISIIKKIIIFIPLIASIIFIIYNYLYSNLFLPDYLITKQQQQTGDFGILIGGRSEIVASLQAIYDKPVWGHGSWASNCEYVYYLSDFLYLYNYEKSIDLYNCQIPSHSVIFGYWVESGIFGFIFWFYILITIFKKYFIEIKNPNSATPLKLFLIFLSIWDILFSPYGGSRMILLPLYITIINSKSN